MKTCGHDGIHINGNYQIMQWHHYSCDPRKPKRLGSIRPQTTINSGIRVFGHTQELLQTLEYFVVEASSITINLGELLKCDFLQGLIDSIWYGRCFGPFIQLNSVSLHFSRVVTDKLALIPVCTYTLSSTKLVHTCNSLGQTLHTDVVFLVMSLADFALGGACIPCNMPFLPQYVHCSFPLAFTTPLCFLYSHVPRILVPPLPDSASISFAKCSSIQCQRMADPDSPLYSSVILMPSFIHSMYQRFHGLLEFWNPFVQVGCNPQLKTKLHL